MCIAILNKSSKVLTEEAMKNCWDNNSDGAGLLYVDNNKQLQMFKELKNFETFYTRYAELREQFPNSQFLIHFRIGTQGLKNDSNCHPFLVNPKLGFIHNGMISAMPYDQKHSDTYILNKMLSMLKVGSENNEAFPVLMKAFAGHANKFVFLNNKNQSFIVNESLGHWFEGDWYSNSSYKQSSFRSWNAWDEGEYGRANYKGAATTGKGSYVGKNYPAKAGTDCELCGTTTHSPKVLEDVEMCGACFNYYSTMYKKV